MGETGSYWHDWQSELTAVDYAADRPTDRNLADNDDDVDKYLGTMHIAVSIQAFVQIRAGKKT